MRVVNRKEWGDGRGKAKYRKWEIPTDHSRKRFVIRRINEAIIADHR